MTRVYLAAPYECRDEARRLERALVQAGVESVSRWLDVAWDDSELSETKAMIDLADVARADVVVVLNPAKYERSGTGGRHAELGFALALQKPIVLVGRRSNVFHHLSSVVIVADHAAAVREVLRVGVSSAVG